MSEEDPQIFNDPRRRLTQSFFRALKKKADSSGHLAVTPPLGMFTSGGSKSIYLDQALLSQAGAVAAGITAVVYEYAAGGYSWAEVIYDSVTGDAVLKPAGRTGGPGNHPAWEIRRRTDIRLPIIGYLIESGTGYVFYAGDMPPTKTWDFIGAGDFIDVERTRTLLPRSLPCLHPLPLTLTAVFEALDTSNGTPPCGQTLTLTYHDESQPGWRRNGWYDPGIFFTSAGQEFWGAPFGDPVECFSSYALIPPTEIIQPSCNLFVQPNFVGMAITVFQHRYYLPVTGPPYTYDTPFVQSEMQAYTTVFSCDPFFAELVFEFPNDIFGWGTPLYPGGPLMDGKLYADYFDLGWCAKKMKVTITS